MSTVSRARIELALAPSARSQSLVATDTAVAYAPLGLYERTNARAWEREAAWRVPVAAAAPPRCLHEIFELQADQTPGAIALECGDRTFSYKDVDAEANKFARYLGALGIGAGAFVGITLDRSEWPVIAILGILKSGAAYVPIEPSLPNDRIRYIAEAAGLAAVIAEDKHVARLREVTESHLVTIDDYRARSSALAGHRLSQIETGIHPADVAYVLFTSGTTGRPKGVVAEHRNVVHFVAAFNEVCDTTAADRVLQGFSLGFDGSVEEIWMAFSNGATLVCGDATTPRFGADLATFLEEKRISFLSTVPTLLSTLPRDIACLRQLVVSGEACHIDLVNRWARPGRKMLNVYGPTEATVNTTAAILQPGVPVTIGRPLRGYDIHILDAELRPVPRGEKGELYIGGPGISRGYLGQPDLTSRSYIDWTPPGDASDDLTDNNTQRLYKAGDLVRWNENGELEFFGRIDSQVKIRGFRVELSEIEAVLLEQPEISAAVVTVYEENNLQHLAAYVLRSGEIPIDRMRVLHILRDRLPTYMVPAYLDELEAFPRLASGKVNRAQLPQPKHLLVKEDAGAAATMTPLEARIAAVWMKQLGLASVGPDQNFFLDLGGHSLMAAGLANALRADLGTNVPVRDIYSYPTVRELAARLANVTLDAPQSSQDAAQQVAIAPKRPWYTPTFQFIYLLSVMPVLALPAVYVLPLGIDALQRRASLLELMVLGLGVVAATWASLIVLAIVAKWVLIGRYRPGSYPMWGSLYIRWWIASRLQHLSHISAFDGTPLAPLIWRLMGAKVGKRCVLNASLVYAWDCIRIGDDVSIGTDTQLPGFRIESGELLIGRIDLGDRCFVGCHSVLGLDVSMSDEAKLDDQSWLPDGAAIPSGAAWRGSPAAPMDVVLPRGEPVRFGFFRLAIFALLQVVCGPAIVLLTLAPLAVGAWLGATLAVNTSFSVWGPAFVALVPATFLTFAIWAAVCKRIAHPRPRIGVFQVYSWKYLQHWLAGLVMQVVKTVGRPVFTTVYLPPWMRLLGARLGRHTEMSTVWRIDPDMLTAGDGVFFADGCLIGSSRTYLGRFVVARNEIGHGSFIGNSAILPSGSRVGNSCLLGVLSSPPNPASRVPDKTDWLGSPGFQLPNRQKVEGFDARLTYKPSIGLYIQRAMIDSLRVLIPGYVLGGIGIVSLLVILAVYEEYGASGAYTAMLLLTWGAVMTCLGTVIGMKWLIMGRFRPVIVPLWSRYVWWNEMVNGLYESLMAPLVTNFFGTPVAPVLLRTLGCKVGKYCYIESALYSEFDLIEIGDHVALNAGTIVQNHLFEDRVMKSSSLRIADGCTVGNMSVVLYDTVMEPNAVLRPLSLLMKGEKMPAGRRWQGSPTIEA